MLAIVVSRPDEASAHIGEQLRDIADWQTVEDDSQPATDGGGTVYRTAGAGLRTFADRHLDLVRPADAFDEPDLLVFASKHAGETGPLLTAHHTGNVGPADHGGEDNQLARACPNAHARVLEALATHAPEGYTVGMEATHHGPSEVGVPSMFVEVGSGPEEWADPEAARAVARSILELRGVPPDRDPEGWRGVGIPAVDEAGAAGETSGDEPGAAGEASGDEPGAAGEASGDESGAPVETSGDGAAPTGPRRHLVGFGGGHYAPRFERLVRETDWAVGHVAPDWGLEALGDPRTATGVAVVEQVFERSRARFALVDGDHPGITETIEDLGYVAVSETWLREASGVPLPLVAALEEALVPVAEGLRVGDLATDASPTAAVVVEDFPSELLAAARDVDAAAVLDAVAERTLGFVTGESGTTVVGPAALPAGEERATLVEALLSVLREGYDDVEWDEAAGEIVARRTRFDPDRAAALGVPEGPAFGQLAAGSAVEVDGREVTPDEVHSEVVDRFGV